MIVTIIPNRPVTQTSNLNTLISDEILLISFVTLEAEIFLTALVPRPKLDKPEIKSIVVINKLEIPNPIGPKNNAIAFDLTIEMIILKN